MQDQWPVHVSLTLLFEPHTVTGELHTADGESKPFVGWLGLLAALERERPAQPRSER